MKGLLWIAIALGLSACVWHRSQAVRCDGHLTPINPPESTAPAGSDTSRQIPRPEGAP